MKILQHTGFFALILLTISATSQNIELKTIAVLNNRVEIKIPKDFGVMSDDMLKLKYPNINRPSLVYTNESGSINVAINLTQSNADQNKIDSYKEYLVKAMKAAQPEAKWKGSGIKTINGRKVGYLELITPAIDTDVYNLMFITDLNGKLLICSFNCTEGHREEWLPVSKEILNSLKLK